eukprot:EG_transcript_27463
MSLGLEWQLDDTIFQTPKRRKLGDVAYPSPSLSASVPRSALLFSEVRRRSLSRSSFGPGSCEGFRLLPNCILAPVPATATGYMCDGPDLSPAPEDATPCDVDNDAPPSDHTSEVDAVAKELFADPPSATAGTSLP